MPQPKRDAVHRYFEFEKITQTSKCLLCEKKMKGNHTSNLKSHLAVKHTTEYKVIQDINSQKTPKTKPKANITDNSAVENLKKYCLRLVTVHGRPLAMMEDEAIQKIINLALPSNADSKQINVKSIKELVGETAYKIKRKLHNEIKHQLVSLKLDSATVTERKFIGINLQYIKDEKIIVRNLAVVEVFEPQTGTFLKNKLEEVLTEFNITTNHIYCVCTDNGANMIKMVKLIGGKYFIEENNQIEDSESSDNEDIEDNEVVDEEFSAVIDSEQATVENEDQAISFEDFEIGNLITNNDFKIRGMLCAAHTLQLAIKDAINKDAAVLAVINLARKIVNILRRPNNTNKIKLAKLRKPIIDCKTRWTSTFDMLKRLMILKDICSTIQEINLVVASNFWTEISTILVVLAPANNATIMLERRNLTIGDFYITWTNCKNEIQNIDHSLAIHLCNAVQERENKLLETDVVLEGLFLDRRLNVILNSEQCEKAKSLIKETHQQLLKIKQDSVEETHTHANEVLPSTSTALSSLENTLIMAERLRGPHRQISSLDAWLSDIMTAPRISLNEDIIAYWNSTSRDFNMLANTILAAPATQVSVERLFSSLKFILNPLRSNLSNLLLQDLMLIRENEDLLDSVQAQTD